VILFLYFCAIFADILAPYNPNESSDQRQSYSPPINIKFNFKEGLYFHPYDLQTDSETFQRIFTEDLSKQCHINLFSNNHLFASTDCPDIVNVWGTDKLGRDYLSRLFHGMRPSLFSAVLAIMISFPIGIFYGCLAGYYKDTIGELMMRFIEVILSLPTLYLLVVLGGLLPAEISNIHKLFLITAILSFIGWVGLARVVRGQVLSICEREYIKVAQMFGTPTWKIMLREIVPQLSSYLIVSLTISFPFYVLGETTLSFLGMGISPPDASLGNLLSEGRELNNLYLRPWLGIIPGGLLVLLAWNCNSMGDHLRNIFDPKGQR